MMNSYTPLFLQAGMDVVKESQVDVVIVGAGPCGLMLANALAKAGDISVRIIDERPVKIAAGQADGIQPRTIEVLQSYGLADRLLREGNQLHVVAFYNPRPDGDGIELTDRVSDVTAPTARYPFELTLHQGAIEDIFLDSMSTLGVVVDRPCVPTSIDISESADSHPVRVELKRTLAHGSETETLHSKYVVGADGAHSWVRKYLNIPMQGEQSDFIWGVVDMVPITNFPDIRNRCAIHSNHGSCMIIPREGDKVRLYIQLTDTQLLDENGRLDKTNMGPNELLEVARRSMHPYTFDTPDNFDWWTIYHIGQRVASKYSVSDRIFLGGDATHTHSPKAGQGMNASMNDTHNLAWKLVYALRGWAGSSLLRTYEQERRNYALDLIAFDKEFSTLFSGPTSHEQFIKAFQSYGWFTSGIGIHYKHNIVFDAKHQSVAPFLVVGQRMPPQILLRAADSRPIELQDMLPSDTRFKLVIFAGDSTSTSQHARLEVLATELAACLQDICHGKGTVNDIFDIVTISTADKFHVKYNSLPPLFNSHWTKVFIDDKDIQGRVGGQVYASFGVKEDGGVVVRPDGYVGCVFPFDDIDYLRAYFKVFLA